MDFPAHITAVLGATNTGKTHYAVERMCARVSGVIGLPLRLLAREVYDKIVAEKGVTACALVTGEEKIVPAHASYFVCTVEAMPMDDIKAGKFACVIIDEVQMVAHKERGHIFTDRLLHARGTEETLLLGADTVRPLIQALVPRARYVTRERFSVLSYTGHTKLSRLPKRTVVVAFSAGEVYALAELMRRHYGGAALVMGGLSPRTRNAQAELYQSGEVDYMVATDAIGMGLNLDADHVAFASLRKFDGTRRRYLRASEMAQIAGRAGRFRKDGSFGTVGSCLPMDADIVGRIENHHFAPLEYAEWRNTKLDFSSLESLQDSLAVPPAKQGLRRIAPAPDELALTRLLRVHEVRDLIQTSTDVRRFWDVCQIPDFRNLGPEAHARLLEEIFTALWENNYVLPDDFMRKNIKRLDHHEGNAEILASRLACIRTWTYIAHKKSWVIDTNNWIKLTTDVEQRLSDALHSKLVQRFVDRRTSALLKGIGAKTHMDALITDTGEVVAEGHTIGQIKGLVFVPAKAGGGVEAKALQTAAAITLAPEIDRRLMQITGAPNDALSLSDLGKIQWSGEDIGKLVAGPHLLSPQIDIIGGELGSPVLRDQAAGRLRDYMRTEIAQKFESLFALKALVDDPETPGQARAMAHTLFENYGALRRIDHMQLIKNTDQTARKLLRTHTVVFGYRILFIQDLMKPAPSRLMSLLFAFCWDKDGGGHGLPFLPHNGMGAVPDDKQYSEEALNKAGYTRVGTRIIRFDILERLHQILLQVIEESETKQFRLVDEMFALLGCKPEDFDGVLVALGYKKTVTKMEAEVFEAEKNILMEQTKPRKPDVPKPATKAPNDKKPETTAPQEASAETPDTPNTPEATPKIWYKPRVKYYKRKPLTIYRARPEMDEDEQFIFPTTIDFWSRDFSKQAKGQRWRTDKNNGPSGDDKNSPAYRDSPRQGSHAPHPSARTGKSGKNKADKLAKYSKFSGKGKKPKQRPQQNWEAKPPQKTKDEVSEDSPFAALSALQFSGPETKKDKKKDK